MREIRLYGSEGGAARKGRPYPYPGGAIPLKRDGPVGTCGRSAWDRGPLGNAIKLSVQGRSYDSQESSFSRLWSLWCSVFSHAV